MFEARPQKLYSIRERMNVCPLGSGALHWNNVSARPGLCGENTRFLIRPDNSMDGVSDRDYVIEFLSALSVHDECIFRVCPRKSLYDPNHTRFIEI